MKNPDSYFLLTDLSDEYRTFIQVYKLKKDAWKESVSRNSYDSPHGKYPQQFVPIELKLEKWRGKPIGDITAGLSPFFVFSDSAVEHLMSLLCAGGDFLETNFDSKGFKGYRVTKFLDKNVLDMNFVSLKQYENGLFLIGDPFFIYEKIKEFDIFMLKEIPLKVFVSSKFKEAIEKNNLKGFNFKKVNVI